MRRRLSASSSQNNQTFLYLIFLAKAERMKQVDTFKYLGFTITPDARCDTEIKKRIALFKDTFTKMKSIFTNRNIKVSLQNQHSETLQMVHPSVWIVNVGH